MTDADSPSSAPRPASDAPVAEWALDRSDAAADSPGSAGGSPDSADGSPGSADGSPDSAGGSPGSAGGSLPEADAAASRAAATAPPPTDDDAGEHDPASPNRAGVAAPPPPEPRAQLAAFARDIKLSHTIFALPFALSAAWLVARAQPVPWTDWIWIVLAMVGARSSAMGMNRIADRRIDQDNPRTTDRELAAGRLDLRWAWGLTLGSAGLLVLAAALLHPLALKLSPAVILWLWGYSFAKRFTALCHLWLGVALGLSPVCVWIALTGGVAPAAWVMGAVIATWVGGFDILYALQDEAYDAEVGLKSIPSWLGAERALQVSEALHLATAGLLVALPLVLPPDMALGWPYALGVTAILGILGWEHRLVKPGDLTQMNKAFFQANSLVSVIFLASVVAAGFAG